MGVEVELLKDSQSDVVADTKETPETPVKLYLVKLYIVKLYMVKLYPVKLYMINSYI